MDNICQLPQCQYNNQDECHDHAWIPAENPYWVNYYTFHIRDDDTRSHELAMRYPAGVTFAFVFSAATDTWHAYRLPYDKYDFVSDKPCAYGNVLDSDMLLSLASIELNVKPDQILAT